MLISTRNAVSAFVPPPLPPAIPWDETLVRSLSSADYWMGQLSLVIVPDYLPLFVTQEAVYSNKIEGIYLSLEQVYRQTVLPCNRMTSAYASIVDYRTALMDSIHQTAVPLSLHLIKALHAQTMHEASDVTPGAFFGRVQNWIGVSGSTVNTARYVPPAPHQLMDCLGAFETFLHDDTLPALVHAALCHYQFEAIHPFLDGNGRVGRLLIPLLFAYRQCLPLPFLSLSPYFYATRNRYYTCLNQVSGDEGWYDWLLYFFKRGRGASPSGDFNHRWVKRVAITVATSAIYLDCIAYLGWFNNPARGDHHRYCTATGGQFQHGKAGHISARSQADIDAIRQVSTTHGVCRFTPSFAL